MANVIVVIGKSLLAHADLSPARTGILLAVERQSRGQRHGERLANGAWVELGVHIEGESDGSVARGTSQTRDAIVFLSVDAGDGERVFEEEWVGHDEIGLRGGEYFRR